MDFTHVLHTYSSLFSPTPLIAKPNLPFTIMILSPHPDDESIIGSLPLRLYHENGAHILNVAVTLGSKKERQKARLLELEQAARVLDMEVVSLSEKWPQKEKELKSLIQKYQPDLILAPHLKDHHPTHIQTGKLLKKVLTALKTRPVLVAWTEFWGPLEKPNLMVEVPNEILNLQMQALEKHVGEVERNPYHLRLPAWMIDNVRRGSELIQGKGEASSSAAFAVLYDIHLCSKGRWKKLQLETPILSGFADIAQIFKLILEAASGSKTKLK